MSSEIGAVYYTDNRLERPIFNAARRQLKKGLCCAPLVTVGLEPHSAHIVIQAKRGYFTMFRQILAGLEALQTKYAFLCEHDVLYHPSHFAFRPARDDVYYYNVNTWKVDSKTGHAITYLTKQTSGLVANRELLVQHYQKRVELVRNFGFSRRMGFEPGSHGRAERVDDFKSEVYRSAYPNLDIRHTTNLTESRWKQSQFRSPQSCKEWRETDGPIEGWGQIAGRFQDFLQEL